MRRTACLTLLVPLLLAGCDYAEQYAEHYLPPTPSETSPEILAELDGDWFCERDCPPDEQTGLRLEPPSSWQTLRRGEGIVPPYCEETTEYLSGAFRLDGHRLLLYRRDGFRQLEFDAYAGEAEVSEDGGPIQHWRRGAVDRTYTCR